jgi:hypothetical protein
MVESMSEGARGSRKHVLDWIACPSFVDDMNAILAGTGARISPLADCWMPTASDPTEAKLDRNGKALLPRPGLADELGDWWLDHRNGANTPNWDIAAKCTIGGQPGLVLVEAKANVPELKVEGKGAPEAGNPRSQANHNKIGTAIDHARAELDRVAPGILIARDTHYQLSNRVAVAWKLASLGVPVVLIYLGFTGDEGIRDAGEPFKDEPHWIKVMDEYMKPVLPTGFTDRDIPCGKAAFRMIVRARKVLEMSPPRS